MRLIFSKQEQWQPFLLLLRSGNRTQGLWYDLADPNNEWTAMSTFT